MIFPSSSCLASEASFEASRNRVGKGVDEPVVGLAFAHVFVVIDGDVVVGEGFAAEVAMDQSERIIIAGFQPTSISNSASSGR